jgi:tRNA dimethylallyltransferase
LLLFFREFPAFFLSGLAKCQKNKFVEKILHLISGPTAVGKTSYALDYAESHNAEIVSCDASLVYRGMDIGTAKPSKEERARVPHHLIDICGVDEPFDIVAYDRAARIAVESIHQRGKSVVVTGGSCFYLKSFFAPVIDTIKVPDSVRSQVAALYDAEGLEGLLTALRRSSPEGFGNLDSLNPRRVVRALERCIASGKSLPELQADFAARPQPYADFSKRWILLERDVETLRERVTQRAEMMIADGLIAEVEQLREAGIERNPPAASAIGYAETLAFQRGEISREALPPAIIQNTLHLVKKQRTWFRTQFPEPDNLILL